MDIKRLFPVADARRERMRKRKREEAERSGERAGSGARLGRERSTGGRLRLTGFPVVPVEDV